MPKKIGIIGYSAAKFDEWKAKNILFKVFNQIMDEHGSDAIIVSGGTMYGVPKLAYFMTARLGYETIGVICKEGINDKLFPNLSELIVEGEHWGDESEKFIETIDELYRIGGGEQSLKEVEMAKKKGIPVYEYELERMD